MTPANYSITELATILKAALLVVDTLDGTGIDAITDWIEETEDLAWKMALELVAREPADEIEGQERKAALAAYNARLELSEDLPARVAAELH